MSILSIFSHKTNPHSENSRQLRRDDVECFSERDLRRHTGALEQEGYQINTVMELVEKAGRDRLRPRHR